MNIYLVKWKDAGRGEYVPPDPVCGGDYYADRYGSDFITCNSGKQARETVLKGRRGVKVTGVELITEM